MNVAAYIAQAYRRLVGSADSGDILKKLNEKQRVRQKRVAAVRLRRRANRPHSAVKIGLSKEARNRFLAQRAELPPMSVDYERREGHLSIIPPKDFSLSSNYQQTLAFIYDFKNLFSRKGLKKCPDGSRRHAYAEFSEIEMIGAGAGLVLAAEIHRFSQSRSGKIQVQDQYWSAGVRDFFIDSGLFDLLEIDPHDIQARTIQSDKRQTLKYLSGRTSSGREVGQLLQRLQELAGQPVGKGVTVYNAIAEALANVDHAYPRWFNAWPYRTSRRWWASGFWDPSSKTVGLQLYDQGAGIPATLPRQTQWLNLLRIFDPERSDAGLIAAAMEYGRTSTGTQGRGKGLSEMADWIESSGSGFLRILSGRGEVTYRPGRKISRQNYDAHFDGTLVQWELSLA